MMNTMMKMISKFFRQKREEIILSDDFEYEVYYLLLSKSDCNFLQEIFKYGFETQQSKTSVTFDYKKVYEFEDNPNITVVGFYHTHPKGCLFYSSTDIQTMGAWTKALNRKLLCVIESDNQIKSWWFFPDGTIKETELMQIPYFVEVSK